MNSFSFNEEIDYNTYKSKNNDYVKVIFTEDKVDSIVICEFTLVPFQYDSIEVINNNNSFRKQILVKKNNGWENFVMMDGELVAKEIYSSEYEIISTQMVEEIDSMNGVFQVLNFEYSVYELLPSGDELVISDISNAEILKVYLGIESGFRIESIDYYLLNEQVELSYEIYQEDRLSVFLDSVTGGVLSKRMRRINIYQSNSLSHYLKQLEKQIH